MDILKCDIIKHINGFESEYIIDIWGNIYSLKRKQYLKINKNKNYPRIKLSKNNKGKQCYLHRLLAETFLDKIKDKNIVNHKDGNPKNFNLNNLEWVSNKENSKHAVENNLYKKMKGKDLGSSKLTEKEVLEIFYAEGTYLKVANHFNISISNVFNIKNKKKWKYLLCNLNNYNIEFKKLKKEDLYNNLKKTQDTLEYEKIILIKYPKYTIDINGNIQNIKNLNYLKTPITQGGYKRVYLLGKNEYVHRLVAETFIHNHENKPFVNHKDGNKINNNIDNLEWVNQSENTIHAIKNHLKISLKGEMVGNSKLKNNEIIFIRNSNLFNVKLSKIYGVSDSLISLIKNNIIWKHI